MSRVASELPSPGLMATRMARGRSSTALRIAVAGKNVWAIDHVPLDSQDAKPHLLGLCVPSMLRSFGVLDVSFCHPLGHIEDSGVDILGRLVRLDEGFASTSEFLRDLAT
jgi:hypothetical protein